MDIIEGSAIALIGRNGVGKSTLLKTIVGVQKLTGGKVIFRGTDVSGASAHGRARAGDRVCAARVGMCFRIFR